MVKNTTPKPVEKEEPIKGTGNADKPKEDEKKGAKEKEDQPVWKATINAPNQRWQIVYLDKDDGP